MKKKWDTPYFKSGLTAFIVIAASVLFYLALSHLTDIGDALRTIFGVLMPFAIGLTLAYVLSPLYDFFERPFYKWFAGKKPQPRRFAKAASKALASVLTMLLLISLFVALLGMVIPQTITSISNLVASLPEKSSQFMEWIRWVNSLFGKDTTLSNGVSVAINYATDAITQWVNDVLLPNLINIVSDVSVGVIGVVTTLTNVGIGLVICVYALNSKELFAAQCKKLTYALWKPQNARFIVDMTRYIHRTFGSFINGKLLDSLLVGILCFIGMSIFGMPNAVLISAIVGIFNILPIFGPIISAIIGAVLELLVDPIQAVWFTVFVIVLQQIDGNILGPKILGETTGLSSFWVIFAILVGGGLFGFAGMLLGVPMFAVVYALLTSWLERRLQKKGLPQGTEQYHGLLRFDTRTREPIYGGESVTKVPVRHTDNTEE